MTGHTLASYRSPLKGLARQMPGLAVCTCTATLEDHGLTKTTAEQWINNHPHHVDNGARDARSSAEAVTEFDFAHIEDVAASVLVMLWGSRSLDTAAVNVAETVRTAARQMRAAVAAGIFSGQQLYEVRDVPRALGKVLESIDPERAR